MYKREARRVEMALRAKGVVAIMLKAHARTPEDVVTTVRCIHEAGLFPEVTYRIDSGIVREAMQEINRIRARDDSDDPLLVGIGSVTDPKELEDAIGMGFDMVVSPDNAFEGFGRKIEFARIARDANVFSAPGAMTPGEFRYWLGGEDGIVPDAIKVFPASVYGPEGLGRMLDPYERERYAGRIVVPTGGVNAGNARAYREHIGRRGFDVVLAMSDPLSLSLQSGQPGDEAAIRSSLAEFKRRMAASA